MKNDVFFPHSNNTQSGIFKLSVYKKPPKPNQNKQQLF